VICAAPDRSLAMSTNGCSTYRSRRRGSTACPLGFIGPAR
jgi:hypothetical protein